MKGIVMETKEHKVIVMAKDGQFIEMVKPNHQLMVGEEIIVHNTKQNSPIIRRFAAVAALFMFILTSSYGVYGYYMPYGHVNVDINPSVEITYNLYKRVIDMKGLNDDGNQVVGNIQDYKNKSLDTIVNKVVDEAVEEKYIKNDGEDFVLVTVTELGKSIDDDQLFQNIDDHMKETKTSAEVMVIDNDKATYELAKEVKASPGKKALMKKVISSNSDVDEVTLLDKPVKEIAHMIKTNDKQSKSSNKKPKQNKVKNNKEKQVNKKQNQNNPNGKPEKEDDKEKARHIELQGQNIKHPNKGHEKKEDKNHEKDGAYDRKGEEDSDRISHTKKNDKGNKQNNNRNKQEGFGRVKDSDDELKKTKGNNGSNKDGEDKENKKDKNDKNDKSDKEDNKEKDKGQEKKEHKK